jgi:hypothetical protein
MSYSEDWPTCMYDSDVFQPNDEMVTYLFFPFEDDLSQHDLHSSFNTYPFEDAYLIYDNSQPLSSYFEDYQDVDSVEQS